MQACATAEAQEEKKKITAIGAAVDATASDRTTDAAARTPARDTTDGGGRDPDRTAYVSVRVAPEAVGPTPRHAVHVIVDREKGEARKEPGVPGFRSYRLACPIRVNNEPVEVADLLHLLWAEPGLFRNVPLSFHSPQTAHASSSEWRPELDPSPACYVGPRAWAFGWPKKEGGVPCSLAWDRNGICLRVHDRDPAACDRVFADIVDAWWRAHRARRPPDAEVPRVPVHRARDQPYAAWGQATERPGRLLQTLYMDPVVKRDLVEGMRRFLDSRDLYERYGVTWKRVHLLHGPPGTGKSSLVLALATAFGFGLCKLTVTPRMTSVDLENLFASVPPRNFLLIEDADALFAGRQAGESGGAIDFSSLLNCLDGVTTRPGLIVFMTTNRVGLLDEALVRPGRVDVRIPFDSPNRDQLMQTLVALGDRWRAEHERFLDAVGNVPVADLQRFLFDCIVLERESILVHVSELLRTA